LGQGSAEPSEGGITFWKNFWSLLSLTETLESEILQLKAQMAQMVTALRELQKK